MSDATGQARWRMSTVGGIAALLAGDVLLVGILGFALDIGPLQPWLAVLFGINAGMRDLSLASLEAISLIDVAMLVLAGLAFAGFWPGPGTPRKAWMALAAALPFAGIAVLLATELAGRSGLMGGGLVLSILMILSPRFRRLGVAGAASNVALLVGDFGTTGPQSTLMAVVVAVGYVVVMVWFWWMAARLLGRRAAPTPDADPAPIT